MEHEVVLQDLNKRHYLEGYGTGTGTNLFDLAGNYKLSHRTLYGAQHSWSEGADHAGAKAKEPGAPRGGIWARPAVAQVGRRLGKESRAAPLLHHFLQALRRAAIAPKQVSQLACPRESHEKSVLLI